MQNNAFQDQYPDDYAKCYGCGRNNDQGLKLKSYWQEEESVCRHTPRPYYSGGFPGFLYGGMIASLMDCHGAATASAAKSRETDQPISRFVTASLKIDFLHPTPLGIELEVRGKVFEIKGRKVIVDLWLIANAKQCAQGRGIFVQIPSPDQQK